MHVLQLDDNQLALVFAALQLIRDQIAARDEPTKQSLEKYDQIEALQAVIRFQAGIENTHPGSEARN